MATPVSLVADIGGTNARFAIVEADGSLGAEVVLRVAEHATPLAAIDAYLGGIGRPRLEAAALAIAAPVDGDSVRLTNAGWTFARSAMRAQLGLSRLIFLNDFAAQALSLPHLAAGDLRQVGGGAAEPLAPKAVLGPGTGLGMSGLIKDQGRWLPLVGEGGHCSLAPAEAREAAILALAWREFPHVSAERLISGTGLPLLHRLVAAVDGLAAEPLTAAQIAAGALAGNDRACVATVETFCALLGGIAGDLALTLGARGGVYIGGGVVPRLGDLFYRSAFRRRFEAKGRFAAYLAAIPAYVILCPTPALRGAAQALSIAGALPYGLTGEPS